MSAIKRITPEIDARLEEVARLKAATPTFEELAQETGLTCGYLRQLLGAKVQIIANKPLSKSYQRQFRGMTNKVPVSRETESA
jgi:hypothetical protein